MILETERLRLREFVPQDADALAAVLGDPVAMQYYPAPFDRKEVEEWIGRNIQRYRREGYGLWAMLLKDSGDLIGDCGCALQEVEGRNEVEVGYHVRRDLWSKGYATEAALACMEYAFVRLGATRVISMIRPKNLQSRRVAEKNGLKCEKIIFWREYEHCIYVRSRNLL
ncbi:MAG TPA: GNAT family N-acetyltransferase [Candidatus Dormibacteraeota bacterium]|nr:GNAT family N-acetyltransferase [Candidatus Dormibacteraeota bacterium]